MYNVTKHQPFDVVAVKTITLSEDN